MYDIVVIGSGPGGYVAAIRAAKLGKRVAVVEKEHLGGICLNWGCIPTKSLLRSAEVVREVKHAASYGVKVSGVEIDFEAIIARSRSVAETMSKGVKFLLDKAGVEIITGRGEIASQGVVKVDDRLIECKDIIIATGARARSIEGVEIDEESIISYRKALSMDHLPESMVVMGSGAIGSELAEFYHTLGCKVTLIEYMPRIMPNEDEEVSKYVERMMRKNKLAHMTDTKVERVEKHEGGCKVYTSSKKGEKTIECEVVLSAVGVITNIENLGLEQLGVVTERGRIVVDSFGKTNIDGVYAIGDVVVGYQLAHVASAEAICCAEAICGLSPEAVNHNIIPRCTYITPEVASIGLTESQAREAAGEIRIGKFPFTASGKATVAGSRDGFIKLIFDQKSDQLLGAHFVGNHVTEMISEISVAMNLDGCAKKILNSVHPHPSLSEAIMEAAAAAHDEAIHI